MFNEEIRVKLIRKYYYDIKENGLKYDESFLENILKNESSYLEEYRHVVFSFSKPINISLRFLLECIKNYQEKKEFIALNDMIDLAISENNAYNPKISFDLFIPHCNGGIRYNPYFEGFVNIELDYIIDESAFANELFKEKVELILSRYAERQYEESIAMDENKREYKQKVSLDLWDVKDDSVVPLFNLLLDSAIGRDIHNITLHSFDVDNARKNIVSFLNKNATTIRQNEWRMNIQNSNQILKIIRELFLIKTSFTIKLKENIRLGIHIDTSEKTLKERIAAILCDITGMKMEENNADCWTFEYDYDLLDKIQKQLFVHTNVSDQYNALFNMGKEKPDLFLIKVKDEKRLCAPNLSKNPSSIIGKKFLWCKQQQCYYSSLGVLGKKYNILDILDIIGCKVIDMTEAGYVPNESYRKFIDWTTKAQNIIERLKCDKCNHILFPVSSQRGDGKFNTYHTYACKNIHCSEYGKGIYLNYCYKCKKSLIDSRVTAMCPNGKCICPNCLSCCSNDMFEKNAERYLINDLPVPYKIQKYRGHGHQDNMVFYCPQCGSLLTEGYYCPNCEENYFKNIHNNWKS